jgi:CheY-like chemotaxis protein
MRARPLAPEDDGEAGLGGLQVLVVAEPGPRRDGLVALLTSLGALVDRSESGGDALARLDAAAPHVVCVDERLGDAVLAALTDACRERSIRVVLLVARRFSPRVLPDGIVAALSLPPHRQRVLDVVGAPTMARAPSPLAASFAPLIGGLDVLVVEDDVVSQRVTTRMLQKLGCHVEVAADGQAAVERTAERRFDLLLMDCRMPRLDGFAATAAIRARGGHDAAMPIVALTAHALATEAERCRAAGMSDFLTKPVQIAELRAMLARHVRRAPAPAGA